MIVNKQKNLIIENKCECIVDEQLLKLAIHWYISTIFDGKPVAQRKKIFMHGKYPAISIHGYKIHVHRLLYSFSRQVGFLKDQYVHHKNENKLDATIDNLELMTASEHQSITNKGRKQSKEWIDKRISKTADKKRGKKYPKKFHENPELLSTTTGSELGK